MVPPEQSPETQEPQRSNSAQALGVIAAASVLGLMVTRVKPGPLLFLAGAAAAAWLNKRRILPPSRPLILMPERPTEEKVADTAPQIDAWLARQMAREQEAPIITLDLQEHLPFTPSAEPDTPPPPLSSPFFNEVPTTVRPSDIPDQLFGNPFLSPTEEFQAPTALLEPVPLQKLQALEATESVPTSSQASWLLGIEPLPSWDELSVKTTDTEPYAPLFLERPPGASYTEQVQEPIPTQPVFLPPLFQGGALPDEFCVTDFEIEPESNVQDLGQQAPAAIPPSVELPSIDIPIESLFSAPISTPPQPAPIEQTVPKPVFVSSRPIFGTPPVQPPVFVVTTNPEEPPQLKPTFGIAEVQSQPPFIAESIPIEPMPAPVTEVIFASPGEASFDNPLDAIRPEHVPPPPLRPHAALIEAEIIVRPRGMAQIPTPINMPEPEAPTPLPSAPIVVPREQRARKTWRSWWRGE